MDRDETVRAATLLRSLRAQQGTTLRAAAADLGVAPSHLSRIERGEKGPGDDLLARAASYYGVPQDALALADGRVPLDVVQILQRHPELLSVIRKEAAALESRTSIDPG